MTAGRETFAALLRGINVGGARKLSMAELRSLLTAGGYDDVVTYIQSGNAVFRSAGGEASETARGIESAIAGAFGLDVTVLLRTGAELDAIASGNPFLGRGPDFSRLHVVFLREPPAPDRIARLDPTRSPGDEFHVGEREVYLRLPAGAGRTKLTLAYFERTLGVEGTARNWNTLLELRELAARLEGS